MNTPPLETEDSPMDENAPDTKVIQWPYTSWKTILNLIQKFEADGGVLPPRIDRSVLGGSEGQKTQVMAALRFLGLMGENGEVTPLFQQFVSSDDKQRHVLVRDLLQRHYPEATKLGKSHATTKQLEETFAGLTGDTLRKAVTFYIHAAKFSAHPLSKHFKTPSGFRPGGVRKQRASNGSAVNPAEPTPQSQTSAQPTTEADLKTRYIQLLMEKAKAEEKLDSSLLDRIEKLLGYPAEKST